MKHLIATMTALLMMNAAAGAATLKWSINVNDRLEITRTAQVKVFLGKKDSRSREERNIIDLTCYDNSGGIHRVKGVFSVYVKQPKEKVFTLSKQYPTDFAIEPNGKYRVPDRYYIPNLRHIPTFPEKDLAQGEKWTSPAELVLDDFSVPFKLIFNVEYVYDGVKKIDGRDAAVINYDYEIIKDLENMKVPADFPVKIRGRSTGTIYWDTAKNTLIEIKEKYKISFFFISGNALVDNSVLQYIETKNRTYSAVTPEEKEKAKKEIQKEIPKDSGIDVDTDKRGLVLRLGEILFDFDSYRLRDDAVASIDKITDILKKRYPDREIIVEGHTDGTGGKEYNYRLSRERARSVAERLQSGTGHDRLSYRGLGPDNPIADNDTKDGRQKNRRVEIIIKLH
jgi:outer membrane protein OmpA-like peptidoglycan-associated protein